MSHADSPHPWGAWADRLIAHNQKRPWIAIGAACGIVMTSLLAVVFHIHVDHDSALGHIVHDVKHYSHLSLWIFMAWLGAEISLRKLREAGLFVLMTTFGGVAIPYLFMRVTLQFILHVDPVVAHAVALGAMATDVAFSIGVADMVRSQLAAIANKDLQMDQEAVRQTELLKIVVIYCLFPLAGGDDLSGVGVMAGEYAKNFSWPGFAVVLLMELGLYWLGEGGRTKIVTHLEDGRSETRYVHIMVDEAAFWHAAAALMTVLLVITDLELIIGGCIVYLVAPQTVKDELIPKFGAIVPPVLLVFGFTACSINVLDMDLWTDARTWAAYIAPKLGKMVGVSGMGFLARKILSAREHKPGTINWAAMPSGQVFTLGNWASAIGTVGIIFLVTAVFNGRMTAEEAQPYILGFLLTVVSTFIENIVVLNIPPLRRYFYGESPDFQPPEEEEDEAPIAA